MKTTYISITFVFLILFITPNIAFSQEDNESTDTTIIEQRFSHIGKPADFNKLFNPEGGKALFVSADYGNDNFAGTKDKPLKTLEKAIELAGAKDNIILSFGNYAGAKGTITSSKALRIYGSFDDYFELRDIVSYPSVISPGNETALTSRLALLVFDDAVDGTIIDGVVFDAGGRNAYSKQYGKAEGIASGALLLPPDKEQDENPTPKTALIQLKRSTKGGEVIFRNSVFLNGAECGINAAHKSGTIKIINNVFVANRMVAIEVFATCDDYGSMENMTKCFDCIITNNTILYTWSRFPEKYDLGCGLRIRPQINYYVTYNIFGMNQGGGIDNSGYHNKEWLRFDYNTFYLNAKADMIYSKDRKQKEFLTTHQFEDIDFNSVISNVHEVPEGVKVDKNYMNGFINTVFREIKYYTKESQINIWRKSLKMKPVYKPGAELKMYGNRYPQKSALRLFGSDPYCGAQLFY